MKLHEFQLQNENPAKAQAFMDEFNGYLKEFNADTPTLGTEWYSYLFSQVHPQFGMKNLALDIYCELQKRGLSHIYNENVK